MKKGTHVVDGKEALEAVQLLAEPVEADALLLGDVDLVLDLAQDAQEEDRKSVV